MRYKHFENANVDVSELAVGTWGIGELETFGNVEKENGKVTTRGIVKARERAIDAIQAALQGGVNLIEILISTKFSLIPDMGRPERGGASGGGSYKNVMREVDESLRLLRTDYIDFYFLHYPDPYTDIAETMSALNVLKKRGIIRYIGLSNHTQAQIEAAMEWGQIDVIQPPFSMVDREMEGLMRWAKSKGIDSMTYGSLGSGLLTGRMRTKPQFDPTDIRGGFYQNLYKDENFEKFLELLKIMDRIAEAHNSSVSQVAINWTTQQEYVGTALCGFSKREHAEQNVAAFDWELSAEELKELDDALKAMGIGDIELLDWMHR